MSKKNFFSGLSDFDKVGLILKICDICLLLAKKGQHPVLIGNAWAEENLITSSSSTRSVYPVKVFLANIFLAVTLFFSLLWVCRTIPVTRDLRNPDYFVVQLLKAIP